MRKNRFIVGVLLLIIAALLIIVLLLFMTWQRTAAKLLQAQIEVSDEEQEESETIPDKPEATSAESEVTSVEPETMSADSETVPADTEKTSSDTFKENAAAFSDGVSTHGALAYEGTMLKDEYGNQVQLRGMSTHGLLWYPEYMNYATVMETRNRGANVMRLAMYANDPSGGYVQDQEMSVKLLHSGIQNIKAADMYAIVDWHVLTERNPIYDVNTAVDFFSNISEYYGDDPYILYEICNEPNGETTWEDIRQYADQVIPAIRRNAPHAVIIVGTPNYSYSLTEVMGHELSYDNVAYSFHFYAGQFGDEYEYIINDVLRSGAPVFVSEWGINTDAGGMGVTEQAKRFADFLNKQGISWCAWGLNNKAECFSVIRPECRRFSGLTGEDLTDVGKVIFAALSEDVD